MRVERQCVLDADRDTVWRVVSDPDGYPSLLANLERWERQTEGPVGVGSRFIVHWRIGAFPVGGTVEVVEFDALRDLAWVSITGITLRGRFRLRDTGNGQTRVTFRLSYQAPGGLLGLIADQVASRQVGRTLAESLKNLTRLVESRRDRTHVSATERDAPDGSRSR